MACGEAEDAEKDDLQWDGEAMRSQWRAAGAQQILTASLPHCKIHFRELRVSACYILTVK
jgi:hypothetical protein